MRAAKEQMLSRSETAAATARRRLRDLLALLEAPSLLDQEGGVIDMGTMHSALDLHAQAQEALLHLMMHACDAQTTAGAAARTMAEVTKGVLP